MPELFETPTQTNADSERTIAQLHKKIGELTVDLDWLKKKVQAVGSVEQRRELIESCEQPSIRHQCELLGIVRSGLYYEPCPETEENPVLMRELDQLHLEHPVYGSGRLTILLHRRGYEVNRKRVIRLLGVMGLQTVYPRRWTSQPGDGHQIYPYLLEGLEITGPDQAWCSDITYVPMQRGFMYLVAVMDWWSRYVLAWALSNVLDSEFCVRAWEQALAAGNRPPRISNTDQGAQFTSQAYLDAVESAGVEVSMDGRGRWVDNRFIERLWRSVKYEDIYLQDYLDGLEAGRGLTKYFEHYNTRRPHSAWKGATPGEVYHDPAAFGAVPPVWDTSNF